MNLSEKKPNPSLNSVLTRLSAVIVGIILVGAISYSAFGFLATDDDGSVVGEMAADCRVAMTMQGVVDHGGCLCIAQSALQEGKLPPKRVRMLETYFNELGTDNSSPMGRPPTAMQLSRKIGLVYGHPFLRAYSNCAASGFEKSAD